jgi:hypothetical protein
MIQTLEQCSLRYDQCFQYNGQNAENGKKTSSGTERREKKGKQHKNTEKLDLLLAVPLLVVWINFTRMDGEVPPAPNC